MCGSKIPSRVEQLLAKVEKDDQAAARTGRRVRDRTVRRIAPVRRAGRSLLFAEQIPLGFGDFEESGVADGRLIAEHCGAHLR
jgi:hypothetical protein